MFVLPVFCSKTVTFTQAQFEAHDWTYTASITTPDNLTEVLTVPSVNVTVQHVPKLQLTVDTASCTFDATGEACATLCSSAFASQAKFLAYSSREVI